ncbi:MULTISPECIES: anaerobic ribonucleoside-triphosphate reductase activating protein [unclassified Sphingobacterium]|uniref:anaerobic ribonucleoside-triphosphate reductase activating protein n=1 Tax=unclassified Sphingobacterium TaxID=2609468 RepID=UPI0020C52BA2|nr:MULTISPECIES: anaerobic ribonucleoside-triphosphate reductase activating protein [unclassified Sphingobacterium]
MANALYDITPFTLLDYPNKAACILWFVGCNMRCKYCYNPDIVFGKGKIGIDQAEAFLKSRKGLLQAVVFSGGECTMHPDMMSLVKIAKSLGYLIKVDTNGARPKLIKSLIDNDLLDYVALDFKGLGQRFHEITVSGSFEAFEETLDILLNANIQFEVRTTVHSQLLSAADLQEMLKFLEDRGYRNNYYMQKALNNVKMIAELGDSNYRDEELRFGDNGLRIIVRG